jgi:hypothetical protein
MRQLYTSPRQENIDRVVGVLSEHGIESTIVNRSNWNRPTYQRFSYSQQLDDRESWAQVWVNRADDYTRARGILRELGIEPVVRHSDELAASRGQSPLMRSQNVAVRVRRIVLLAVGAALVMLVLRYMRYI